jgi:hypothetical protein
MAPQRGHWKYLEGLRTLLTCLILFLLLLAKPSPLASNDVKV